MRSAALTAAVALAACGSHPRDRGAELGWFPDDAITIVRWSGGGPLVGYLRSTFEHGPPPPGCFDRIAGAIDDAYQIELRGRPRLLSIFTGDLDRDEVEDCAVDTLAAVGLHVDRVRDGALTRFAKPAPGTRPMWLGWAPGRVVLADDREVVARLGANPHPLPADAALARLWSRTEGELRIATIRDWSQVVLGVPSRGAYAGGDVAITSYTHSAPVHVVYASDADADRALAALRALHDHADTRDLAGVIDRLHARRDGHELLVEALMMFDDPAAIRVFQRLAAEHAPAQR